MTQTMLLLILYVYSLWPVTVLASPVDEAIAQGQWEVVERLLIERNDTEGLLLRGIARRTMGYLDAALKDHKLALQQAATPELKTRATHDLAETLLAKHRYEGANELLQTVESDCELSTCAKLALLRGHLEAIQDTPEEPHTDKARAAYTQARDQAQQAGLTTINIQARLGLFDLAPSTTQELTAMAEDATKITPTYVQTNILLGLAERARQNQYFVLAEQLLTKVQPQVADGRQLAEFLALQSSLLEDAGHPTEALAVTGEAVAVAQRVAADDLLLYSEWRRGRMYSILGDQARALLALRRAVYHLKAIRTDIPIEYRAGRSSFRETLSPLYLGLTDLLLRQAAKLTDDAAQPLLLEARSMIEQLKAAELQDYLGEVCALDLQPIANLEAISPRTGVLYPILLPDRLVLLLGIGEHQYQAELPIKADTIRSASTALSSAIRNQPTVGVLWSQAQPLANKLFTWLIAPIKSQLEAGDVKTLVVVPDGPLRLFPFSVLMDGDKFLVESYAIVTAPSLTLMEPQALARGKIQALVAGMSELGPVVDEYAAREGLENLAPSERQAIIEKLALPGVSREVASISKTLGSDPLLNKDFTKEHFSNTMRNQWRIVHVATHGFFGGTPDSSYFMTYDHLLTMRQLEAIIESDTNDPPELLTLSACQTAEGNDRAPLGITGVAVKSGARSAIGSLWPVSDAATQMFFSEFYRLLPDSARTKAQAFQQAQLLVLNNQQFRHPFYWSPFILIGNWL